MSQILRIISTKKLARQAKKQGFFTFCSLSEHKKLVKLSFAGISDDQTCFYNGTLSL